MSPRKDRSDKTAKELFLEQAAAYFDDLNAAANNAPYGQVFNHAEAFCLQQGRELIRMSLETMMQEQFKAHEKKETTLCQKCKTKKRHRGYRRKRILCALGTVTVERRYDECSPCHLPEHAADEPLGLEHPYVVRSEFGKVHECLDNCVKFIGHALEHLSETGKVLYGAGEKEAGGKETQAAIHSFPSASFPP